MADNEIRFVHREETFNDLAVRELAKGAVQPVFAAFSSADAPEMNAELVR